MKDYEFLRELSIVQTEFTPLLSERLRAIAGQIEQLSKTTSQLDAICILTCGHSKTVKGPFVSFGHVTNCAQCEGSPSVVVDIRCVSIDHSIT